MNGFKRLAWIAVAFVMMLSAWSSITSQDVLAQMRIALMRNVDEPGLNPYQVGFIALCPSGFCDIEFPQVPAGKRLVVKHVSVTNSVATQLKTDAVDAPVIWLASQSQEVHYFVEAGQRPVIHVTGDEKVGMTIVGYLVSTQ